MIISSQVIIASDYGDYDTCITTRNFHLILRPQYLRLFHMSSDLSLEYAVR